jgi:hypothetical protein
VLAAGYGSSAGRGSRQAEQNKERAAHSSRLEAWKLGLGLERQKLPVSITLRR